VSKNFEAFILVSLGMLIILMIINTICINEISNDIELIASEIRAFKPGFPYLKQ
jgi:hypothetical protein